MARTLRLTRSFFKGPSALIAILSDSHFPNADIRVHDLVVRCCDDNRINGVVWNGDTADSGVVSRHEDKRKKDAIEWGTLKKACASALPYIRWSQSKDFCIAIRGNHEAWVEKKIAEDAGLRDTVTPEQLMGWPEDGDGWTVLPSLSKLKIGSLCIEHGDGPFKRGNGGENPAKKLLKKAPNQTTIIGHLHRMDAAYHTMYDENEREINRSAYCAGHLSIAESHEDYMGTYPGWQQSFTFVRVNWEGPRAKYTVYPVQIFRKKNGDPSFEFNGVVYG